MSPFLIKLLSMLIVSSCSSAAAASRSSSFAVPPFLSSSSQIMTPSTSNPAFILPPITKSAFRIQFSDDFSFPYVVESTCVSRVHRGGGGTDNQTQQEKPTADNPYNKAFMIRIGIEAFLSIILIAIGEYRHHGGQSYHQKAKLLSGICWSLGGAVSMGAVLYELATKLGEDAIKIVGAAVILMGILLLLQL